MRGGRRAGNLPDVVAVVYSEIHETLRSAVPEFRPSIDEHIAAYDEVLPHVLFGELTRFVIAAQRRGDRELTGKCLHFLDFAIREGDPMVKNLVAVSFVENVLPGSADTSAFIESWPEGLLSEAERQRDWKRGRA